MEEKYKVNRSSKFKDVMPDTVNASSAKEVEKKLGTLTDSKIKVDVDVENRVADVKEFIVD